MSTNDVPGADPINNDVLKMGCWAEHADGSMILVEGTESNSVVYCIFDRAFSPPVEYRDAMPEINFKRQFSWKPGDSGSKERWTWHDKTPFPWNKIIKQGARSGVRFADAEGLETAAQRVGKSLNLRAQEFDEDRHAAQQDQELARANAIYSKIADALGDLSNLPAAIGTAVANSIKRAPPKKPKRGK